LPGFGYHEVGAAKQAAPTRKNDPVGAPKKRCSPYRLACEKKVINNFSGDK
jgi:hypothetical protein